MANERRQPLVVMKFGGTSVGDANRIAAVADLVIEHSRDKQLVVVVSAMAGITELLLGAAQAASRGEGDRWPTALDDLVHCHTVAAEALLAAAEREKFAGVLAGPVRVLEKLCEGFSLVGEATPRALDALAGIGEVLSANLVAATLRGSGIPAEAVDAVEMIITDERFGNASPIYMETYERTRRRLDAVVAQGAVPVVTGFRGATRAGAPTTLGRGASDYTATLVGAAMDADEVWILTDVDGVMTADPRLVGSAHVIPELSYRETIELSFFGAKVLHHKAVLPVWKKNIPVLIKNSFRPECTGTKICAGESGRPGVKAITSVARAHLFTVTGTDSLVFARLAAEVFTALAVEEIPTLILTQSSAENVISFATYAADGPRARARLEKALEIEMRHDYVDTIEVMPEVGVIVALGEQMKGIPGIAGHIFGALGRRGINVIAIAQGSSELSISLAVRSKDVPEAVGAIHEEFHL